MKIRNKRLLQSNYHVIQSMNVSQQDKSHQYLNYYARNSPKVKRFMCHSSSPLTTSPSSHRSSGRSFRQSSIRPSSVVTHVQQELQHMLNSSINQIRIEEEDSIEILIDEGQPQMNYIEESHQFPLQGQQITDQSLESIFYSDVKEEEWIGVALNNQNNGGSDIKIQEEEQFVEGQGKQNQMNIKDDKQVFNLQKKQEQGLIRQFTFALQLSELNVSDQSSTSQNRNLSLNQDRLQAEGIDTPVSELRQIYISEDQQQQIKSNGYQSEQKPESQPVLSRSKHMTLLIIEEDDHSQNIQDYQSPKFSSIRDKQPIWQKSQKKSQQIKIQDQQTQIPQKIDKQDIPKKIFINKPKHAPSAFSRPFGGSILKLNQILTSIPKDLCPIYHQVYRKLIVDQIKVEQKLQRQQKTINNIKTLIHLKNNQIQCEQYLLLRESDSFQQEIMLNKLLIMTLVRQLAVKKLE